MFQIHALPAEDFAPLFDLSDEELAARKATRMVVDASPGTPCRVSLEDARVGEEVILVNYQHQTADSPYQSNHALFIRKGVSQSRPAPGEIPTLMRHRLISVRAFDQDHMIVDADAVEGTELEAAIERFFGLAEVGYIHLHYAMPGCFAAHVARS